MDEQTSTPPSTPFVKKKVDSNMAILLTLTVALVFAWVFYFFYIYQTQEISFSMTVKQKETTTETSDVTTNNDETLDTVTEEATAT